MPRVFITGSADGLGRATARTLLDDGHEVVVHARSRERLAAVDELLDRGAVPVAGLSTVDVPSASWPGETRLAEAKQRMTDLVPALTETIGDARRLLNAHSRRCQNRSNR